MALTSQQILEGDILDLVGLSNLPEEQKVEVRTKLMESLMNRVMIRVADIIGDAGMEEFQQTLDSGDDNAIRTYLEGQGIDLKRLAIEEAILLKTEVVEGIEAVKTGGPASVASPASPTNGTASSTEPNQPVQPDQSTSPADGSVQP